MAARDVKKDYGGGKKDGKGKIDPPEADKLCEYLIRRGIIGDDGI